MKTKEKGPPKQRAPKKKPEVKQEEKPAEVVAPKLEIDDTPLQGLTGCVLRFHWWAPVKTFARSESQKVADAFGAKADRLTNRKALISKSQQTWKKLSELKVAIRSLWYHYTLPYYIDGIRLMPRERKGELFAKIEEFRPELEKLVAQLQSERDNIVQAAKDDLGELFDETAIPKDFAQVFGVTIREISIEPPRHLLHINSEEYKRELAASLQDVKDSLKRFEGECWSRLRALSDNLAKSLNGDQRIFASQIAHFGALFDRCSLLNFEGTAIFRQAAADYTQLLGDVSAEELRSSDGLREEKRAGLEEIVKKYQSLLVSLKETVEE